jgi:hypothetical protein
LLTGRRQINLPSFIPGHRSQYLKPLKGQGVRVIRKVKGTVSGSADQLQTPPEPAPTVVPRPIASVRPKTHRQLKTGARGKASLPGKQQQLQVPNFRSELRSTIALVLLSERTASDDKVCRLVDGKPPVAFPAGWKDEKGVVFRSLESAYKSPQCHHKVESEISAVRRTLNKAGLLKG